MNTHPALTPSQPQTEPDPFPNPTLRLDTHLLGRGGQDGTAVWYLTLYYRVVTKGTRYTPLLPLDATWTLIQPSTPSQPQTKPDPFPNPIYTAPRHPTCSGVVARTAVWYLTLYWEGTIRAQGSQRHFSGACLLDETTLQAATDGPA